MCRAVRGADARYWVGISIRVKLMIQNFIESNSMNEEPESLAELSERVGKIVQYIDVMDDKATRRELANTLILQAISNAVRELDPAIADAIPQRLELIRTRTKGDAATFQAIEDALKFFRP